MKILIVQILLNVIILGLIDGKYLKIYRRLSYIFYPILLTVFVMFIDNEVVINKQNWAMAADITFLFKPTYYIMIIMSVVIQILFNTQYLKLLKLKKNNV
jgi:hypothetical protein